uniref:SET domain-containing protein n=1 Tax=Trypanosoma congolense (strain IL3000) TaxID=1068625 RepID=G0ULR2_TRYCI|nr:conserved hypothetical protein [Trypanosoma congolense IL3000]
MSTGGESKDTSLETTSVRHIDGRRGRGLVAEVDFDPDSTILCVQYDIAVLYSPFVRNTCYRCFESVPKVSKSHGQKRSSRRSPTRQSSKVASKRTQPRQKQTHIANSEQKTGDEHYECNACQNLVLCEDCVRDLVAVVQRQSASSGSPVAGEPCSPEERLRLLESHPLLQVHKQACAWYCSLPETMRDGDTDYLRFALQYGARALLGDTSLLLSVEELCTNATQQSPESREFCASFARRVVDTFAPQGFRVDADHLRDVLLRTKCNSIGYPFDDEQTLGWLLQEKLCMINHSCDPNAAIVRPRQSTLTSSAGHSACSVELIARRKIKAGEEITIAYIDVDSYGEDHQARRRHLLESYWFLCMCNRCETSAGTTAPSPSPPPPEAAHKKSSLAKNKNKRRKNGRQW